MDKDYLWWRKFEKDAGFVINDKITEQYNFLSEGLQSWWDF